MTKIYLIAGEPSGDVLGAKLITSLRCVFSDLTLYGMGGESMRAKGFESLFDISPLSVMGLFEVIPSIPEILFLEHQLIEDILEKKPDIVITIDSYSFSSRIHKKLVSKGVGIKHVHVVAPQVWAWKAHRAQQSQGWARFRHCGRLPHCALLPRTSLAHQRGPGGAAQLFGYRALTALSCLSQKFAKIQSNSQTKKSAHPRRRGR